MGKSTKRNKITFEQKGLCCECREIETNSALSKHNLESSVPNSQGLNNINEQFHKASWIQLAWIKKDLFSNEVVLATSYSVTTFQRICTG